MKTVFSFYFNSFLSSYVCVLLFGHKSPHAATQIQYSNSTSELALVKITRIIVLTSTPLN